MEIVGIIVGVALIIGFLGMYFKYEKMGQYGTFVAVLGIIYLFGSRWMQKKRSKDSGMVYVG